MAFVSITMVLLVIAAAFAVDIGRTVVDARDARNVADLAALDAARSLDGRITSEVLPDVERAAAESAERNGWSNDWRLDVTVGTVPDARDGSFTATSADEVPDAVQVVARATTDNSFQPGTSHPTRTAVARGSGVGWAAISLSSGLATVDTTKAEALNGLIGSALGGRVDVTAVGWNTLAGVNVTLGDLAYQLTGSARNVQRLLDTAWTMADIVAALAAIEAATPAGPYLRQLQVGTSPATVRLGDAFHLALGTDGGHRVTMSALDLVRAAGLIAVNGTSLDLRLSSTVGNVAGIDVTAHLLSPPSYAVGGVGTTVRNSQVSFAITVSLVSPALTVSLYGESAAATATVTSISCPAGGGTYPPERVGVDVTTGAATFGVGRIGNAGLPVSTTLLDARLGQLLTTLGLGSLGTLANVLGLANVGTQVVGFSRTDVAQARSALTFVPTYGPTPQRISAPTAPTTLLDVPALTLSVTPINVTALTTPILASVRSLLNGVVRPALDSVAPPLFDALGAGVAVADVSVPQAECQSITPTLVI